MHVDQCVDAGCSQLVDQDFDLVEVSVIVLAGNALNGLPHHSETHKVETPVLEVLDVLSIQ